MVKKREKKVTYEDVTKRMKRLSVTGVSHKVSPKEHMAHLDIIESRINRMKKRKKTR